MTITAAYQWLTDNLHNRAITLDAVSFENDAMFWRILSALARPALELVNCDINMVSGIINVAGEASLANDWLNDAAVIKKQNLVVKLTILQDGDKLAYEFKAALAGTFTFAQFFGDIAPQFMRGDKDTNGEDKSGFILFLPSNIADFVLINPELSAVSARDDNFDENLPLGISADFKFANTGLWAADFSEIINKNINAKVTGSMSLYPKYERYLPFLLTIKLFGNMEPQAHSLLTSRNNFTNVLPEKVSLAFILQHGLMFSEYDMLESLTITSVFLQFGFQFRNVQTPFYFFNFFTGLFGVGGNDGLLLPPSLNINRMKLYALGFGMERSENRLTLTEAQAVLALSEEWELLKGIRLRELSMFWHIQWGGERHLLTGNIAAQVDIDLPGNKLLTLEGRLRIPSLELSASLELIQKNAGKYRLDDIIGSDAVRALPDGRDELLLARLDIEASYYDRRLEIYAEVHNLLTFRLGNVEINLSELHAGATFAQTGNSFVLGGSIDFYDDQKADALLFALSLEGSYTSGEGWRFSGGLSRGKVSIIDLIRKFVKAGGEYSGFDIALTQLDFEYTHGQKGTSYRLLAAFSTDKFELLGIETQGSGKILLTSNERKENYLSLMARLVFGQLDIVVQADDFYSDNPYYYLQLGFRKSYIMGSYSTKNNEKIINISFKNLTFGDIVSWMIELINPNVRYDLPAPWNVLNKIDLSKMNFEINLTTGEVSFIYNINLNILNLAVVEYIGIKYNKNAKNGNKVLITGLVTITGGKNQEFEFDPVTEDPPAIAQNPKLFHLIFLALGQHMSTDEINKADSIDEAIEAMQSAFNDDSIGYSESSNWIFGAKFTVKDSLQVSVVLNDPNLYGLVVELTGDALLPTLKGLRLEILYKKISKTIGMFRGTLTLPVSMRQIQLGVVSITCGTFSIEIYTNGDFLVDLGFPHNRNFSGSFAFEFGYFSGRGGFYFGVLSGDTCTRLPPVKRGQFKTVVAMGIGLDVGIGRSFNFGIVSGGLSLSVMGIFEGLFASWEDKACNETATYIKAEAVIGIVGRIHLKVNLVIITLTAEAEIVAYAAIKIESYRKTLISLHVSVRLSATIKILFIKIKVGFHFSQGFSFTIGSDSVAPWEKEVTGLRLSKAVASMFMSALEAVKTQETETEIKFTILPLSSIAAGSYVVAWQPVLKQSDFTVIANIMSDWLLAELGAGEIYADAALSKLADEHIDEITYQKLAEYFELNAVTFTPVECESPSADGNETEGVIMSMPPSVSITYNRYDAAGESDDEPRTINFAEDGKVTDTYIMQIAEYFKSFDIQDTAPNTMSAALNDEGTPIAQVLFRDYFIMILRSAAKEAKGLFSILRLSCDEYKIYFNDFGLTTAQILADNLNLKLGGIEGFVIPSRSVTVMETESFADAAERAGFDADTLVEKNKDKYSLLLDGVIITLPEAIIFDNSGYRFPVKILAAAFFVRHLHYTIDGDYRRHYEYAAAVIEAEGNPLNWICDGTGFVFNDGILAGYTTMAGDTVEILEKMCVLLSDDSLNSESPYFYKEWSDYLVRFMAANNCAAPDAVPVSVTAADAGAGLRVDGDLTLRNLVRRLYASDNVLLLKDQKLLRRYASLTAEETGITINVDTDIKTLMETYQLSLDELASAFERNVGKLVFDGFIDILSAQRIPGKLIKDRLYAEDFTSALSGAVSRFMLQGLRLPKPNENTEVPKETSGLYELGLSQFVLGSSERVTLLVDNSFPIEVNRADMFLPYDNFNWQEHYAVTPIESADDYFAKVAKVYPVQGGFVCAHRAYHLFSNALVSDFKDIASPVLRYKDEDINAGYGIMLKLAAEEQDGIIIMHGASPQDRLRLRGILDRLKDTVPDYKLLYKPSSLTGLANTLIDLQADSETHIRIIKTNLSKETHMLTVNLSQSQTDNNEIKLQYIADFGSLNFLKLLWECSVVDGGYYICLNKPFDSAALGENKYLWLYIETPKELTKELAEYINCAVSDHTALAANSATLDMYASLDDENCIDYQPLLAPGHYGVRITCENIDETKELLMI